MELPTRWVKVIKDILSNKSRTVLVQNICGLCLSRRQ